MKTIIILIFLFCSSLFAKDFRSNKLTKNFIARMVKEYNIKPAFLDGLFQNVDIQEFPLRLMLHSIVKSSSEKIKKHYPIYGAWDRYKALKVTPLRAKEGAAFIRKYKTAFEKAEQKFGVPKEYIAAIIGIESHYGKNVGKYPVFDTLSTLSFIKNRRNRFYQSELKALILLCIRNNINIKNVKGSHFGAIGLGQFMPSNYEYYGVDFNGDGKIRMQNPVDAIGSIAKYLYKNGWKRGEEVAIRARYRGTRFHRYKTGYTKLYDLKRLKGVNPRSRWRYRRKIRLIKLNRAKYDELWIAARNFRVITRYNHSAYYAMSVHQLAQMIKKRLH